MYTVAQTTSIVASVLFFVTGLYIGCRDSLKLHMAE